MYKLIFSSLSLLPAFAFADVFARLGVERSSSPFNITADGVAIAAIVIFILIWIASDPKEALLTLLGHVVTLSTLIAVWLGGGLLLKNYLDTELSMIISGIVGLYLAFKVADLTSKFDKKVE